MIFESEFGFWERVLHRFAFRSGFSQLMLAEMEDGLFAESIDAVTIDRPVYISGLPRSGTTLLLQIFSDTGLFATHTYEDMPFVLCPMLWNRFSRRFTRTGTVRMRAHADGIEISGRSPEAFEEIIWRRFWPDQYRADRIVPWPASSHKADFEVFFARHMAKIILVRGDRCHSNPRYLSKNNANIARLACLQGPLRRGIVVLPYREPIEHAASMLRVHERFTRLQSEDPFAREYMEAIGHHDFGLGLRPIDFGGWLDEGREDSHSLEFWLRYWTAAYRHVLAHRSSSVHLVSFDELTDNPATTLGDLALAVQVAPSQLTRFASSIKPAPRHGGQGSAVGSEARAEAAEVYAALEAARRHQVSDLAASFARR